jgi:hypothetical protein
MSFLGISKKKGHYAGDLSLSLISWDLQIILAPKPSWQAFGGKKPTTVTTQEHQGCIDCFMLYIVLFQSANSPAPAVNACILVHWSVTNRTTVGTTVMKKTVSW